MKEIKTGNLKKFEFFVDNGGYSSIHKCFYDGLLYAYKEFDQKYILLNILEKIKTLGDLNVSGSILPEYLVIADDNSVITYLTKWSESYTLEKYYIQCIDNEKSNILISILNELKQNILILHNKGIIHGDIHSKNVLVNPDTNLVNIIDFDNCAYKNFNIDKTMCNIKAKKYINKYGVNRELDIFLFNCLTFRLINNLVDNSKIREYILNDKNEYFKENDDYKNICETLLLEAKKPTDKFLIDNYQKVLQ